MGFRRFAVVLICALALAACGGDKPSPASPATTAGELKPAPEGLPGVVEVPVAGADHVSGKVSYPTNPPAGGPHNAAWQNCGFYTVAVTAERAVHSLEHGAVWIAYKSSLDAAAKAELAALARASQYVLVSPIDDQPSPISAVAWGRLLRLDKLDVAALTRFIDTYAQDGPTVPEVGARCSGAIGTPPDRPNSS